MYSSHSTDTILKSIWNNFIKQYCKQIGSILKITMQRNNRPHLLKFMSLSHVVLAFLLHCVAMDNVRNYKLPFNYFRNCLVLCIKAAILGLFTREQIH